MSHLFISEKFYSIQGEGVSTGVPAIFLRLSGCNILCQSENWVCDSIDVWKKGVKTEFKDVFTEEEIKLFNQGVHLVITGGEPLMHQKKLTEFFKWFEVEIEGFLPYMELETNGTIIPYSDFSFYIDQWNCSPKLSNSGEKFDRRHKPDVLKIIRDRRNSWFKFVVSCEDDVKEILSDYSGLIDKEKIILMPAGDSQELLEKTRPLVLDLCKKYMLRYSDRLHIVAWNRKTGV